MVDQFQFRITRNSEHSNRFYIYFNSTDTLRKIYFPCNISTFHSYWTWELQEYVKSSLTHSVRLLSLNTQLDCKSPLVTNEESSPPRRRRSNDIMCNIKFIPSANISNKLITHNATVHWTLPLHYTSWVTIIISITTVVNRLVGLRLTLVCLPSSPGVHLTCTIHK